MIEKLLCTSFLNSRDGQLPMFDPTEKVLGCPNMLTRRHPLITERSQFLGKLLQKTATGAAA
jgi:hypothetical protein